MRFTNPKTELLCMPDYSNNRNRSLTGYCGGCKREDIRLSYIGDLLGLEEMPIYRCTHCGELARGELDDPKEDAPQRPRHPPRIIKLVTDFFSGPGHTPKRAAS